VKLLIFVFGVVVGAAGAIAYLSASWEDEPLPAEAEASPVT
jgi:hypothetical protein